MSVAAILQLAAVCVLLHFGGVVAPAPYVLGPGQRLAVNIFNIRLQQALTEFQDNAGLSVAHDAAILYGLNPNSGLAIHLKMILERSFEAQVRDVTGVTAIFALFVSDAVVIPNFRRRREVWIAAAAGNTGVRDRVSNGLAHWPSLGHTCRSTQVLGRVSPRDHPMGHPCNEGGAVALKGETWYGTLNNPKNVMAFYMLLPSLEVVSRMDQPDLVRHNDAFRQKVAGCLYEAPLEVPIDVTKLAECIRDPPLTALGAVAAAVAARAVGRDIAGNPDAVPEQDNNLCGHDIPDGSMFFETRFISVYNSRQRQIGQMKLLIVILPFIA